MELLFLNSVFGDRNADHGLRNGNSSSTLTLTPSRNEFLPLVNILLLYLQIGPMMGHKDTH